MDTVTKTSFDKVLSSANTPIDVSNIFHSLGGDISLDLCFQLFKKWEELVIIEEKNVKTLDNALSLYYSTTNFLNCLKLFLSFTQFGSDVSKIMRRVQEIHQRIDLSRF